MSLGGMNSQGSRNRPGSHGFFHTPFSTTGWGFRNAHGNLAFDVAAPGKNSRPIAAPSGYGVPRPLGMSEKDSNYFYKRAGAQYELSNQLLPYKSQIAKLTANNYGLYNAYAKDASTAFGHQVDQAYGALAGRGFLNSGAADQAARQMASQQSLQMDELSRQYGKLAVGDLRQGMSDQRQMFRNQLMQLLIGAYTNKQQMNTLGG